MAADLETALTALDAATVAIATARTTILDHLDSELPALPLLAPVRAATVLGGLGVCTHIDRPPYSTNLDKVIDAVNGLHLSRLRCRLFPNNTAQREAFVRIHAETGATFLAGFGQPGQKASPAAMVAWAATFPPGVITATEGPNEPNLQQPEATWVDATRKWMADLAAALRASDKGWLRDLTVLSPALGMRRGYTDLGPIPQAGKGNLHVYQGGGQAAFRLDENVTAQRAVTGDAPVWVSETGYHNAMDNRTGTHLPTSEEATAVYLPQVVLEIALRPEVEASYVYELADSGADPNNQEHRFGLFRNDWTPKPAYHALKAVTDLFADDGPQDFDLTPVPVAIDGPPDLAFVFAARSDGAHGLAMWRRIDVWDRETQRPLTPTTEPVTVRVGRADPVTVHQGAAVTVTRLPVQLNL